MQTLFYLYSWTVCIVYFYCISKIKSANKLLIWKFSREFNFFVDNLIGLAPKLLGVLKNERSCYWYCVGKCCRHGKHSCWTPFRYAQGPGFDWEFGYIWVRLAQNVELRKRRVCKYILVGMEIRSDLVFNSKYPLQTRLYARLFNEPYVFRLCSKSLLYLGSWNVDLIDFPCVISSFFKTKW